MRGAVEAEGKSNAQRSPLVAKLSHNSTRFRFGRLIWWHDETGISLLSSTALTMTAVALVVILTPYRPHVAQQGIPVVAVQPVLAELGISPSEESESQNPEFARMQPSDPQESDAETAPRMPDEPFESEGPAIQDISDLAEVAAPIFQEITGLLEQAQSQLALNNASRAKASAAGRKTSKGRSESARASRETPQNFSASANAFFKALTDENGGKLLRCPTASELPATMLDAVRSSFAGLRSGNALDLALVIDATGSMSDDIKAVRTHLDKIIDQLKSYQESRCDLRVALILYRDRTPDSSFVVKTNGFSRDLNELRNLIQNFSVGGGGDEPEAVYDAIYAALHELDWRGDLRTALVIGDAPPHAPSDGLGPKSPIWLGLAARSREVQVNLKPILVGK